MKKLVLGVLTVLFSAPFSAAYARDVLVGQIESTHENVYIISNTEYFVNGDNGHIYKGVNVYEKIGSTITDSYWYVTNCASGKYVLFDQTQNEIIEGGVVKAGSVGKGIFDYLCNIR